MERYVFFYLGDVVSLVHFKNILSRTQSTTDGEEFGQFILQQTEWIVKELYKFFVESSLGRKYSMRNDWGSLTGCTMPFWTVWTKNV